MALIQRIVGLVLTGATVPFLAQGSNKIALAQTEDLPRAVKADNLSVQSRTDFFSFNFNNETKKYVLKSAKEESIAKYLREQEGQNREQIKSELDLLWVINQGINKKIAPLNHKLFPLKEINEFIPDADENDPKVLIVLPLLLRFGVNVVESIPQKFPPDNLPASVRNVDINSIAIRRYGRERENVLSFKETLPEEFDKPDGKRFERMVIYPLSIRLIITKDNDVHFVNVK